MISVKNSALIVVDVQGKLAEIVHESEFVLNRIETLIKGAKLLDLPILWIEQYPEGLGPTVEQLRRHLPDAGYVRKRTFSACLEPSFMEKIAELKRNSFIVTGIESHVCVYQTVKDLLAKHFDVEVVVDAVSSRTAANRKLGIEKMQSLGASLTSVEMVLFELMETSKHPKFRDVSALIK